jgi:peptide/nickel transport system ATP-binding protein
MTLAPPGLARRQPAWQAQAEAAPLLSVRDLRTTFVSDRREIRAVDGVSFEVARGRTLCVVGESGSGKSVTALSVMGLIAPPGRVEAASMMLDGQELVGLDREAMRRLRGRKLGMIFQEPMTSLNPAFTVGDQIAEGLIRNQGLSRRAARDRAVELLTKVRIPSPQERVHQYPHQLSGGMRQRVMIAMAIACEPALLIADEPTTALDVTIQAQILRLMRELRDETGMGMVLITHDLGVVAEIADEVAVMYAGEIVERADVRTLFNDPQHPYTLGLLGSIPKIAVRSDRLPAIPGSVPSPAHMPAGCRFHPRCVFGTDRCVQQAPPLRDMGPGHGAACWYAPVEHHA